MMLLMITDSSDHTAALLVYMYKCFRISLFQIHESLWKIHYISSPKIPPVILFSCPYSTVVLNTLTNPAICPFGFCSSRNLEWMSQFPAYGTNIVSGL